MENVHARLKKRVIKKNAKDKPVDSKGVILNNTTNQPTKLKSPAKPIKDR